DYTGTRALGNGIFVFTREQLNELTAEPGNGTLHRLNENLAGVFVSDDNDKIGGAQPGAGNVISGNGGDGIVVLFDTGHGNGTVIQGNYIGTDVTGTLPLGNGADGLGGDGIIVQNSANNLIGGPFPGAGNVISANGGNGVSIVVD